MPGLFGIFELGRRSLASYQAAINTAGHNVANAATPGYHRQRAELRAGPSDVGLFGGLGSGVRVASISRVQNRFLDLALEREIPVLSRYSARAAVLAQSELVFHEPSEQGITTVLDRFFDGWDDLASSPEDSGSRESVVRLGSALATTLADARERLVEQQRAIDGEVVRTLDDSNRVIHELRTINQAIRTNPESGSTPPDLEDRRDLLIQTVADLLGAESTIEPNGTATLRLNGRIILQEESVEDLQLDLGRSRIPRLDGKEFRGGELDGRLGGLLEARDNDLGSMIRRLDEFAVRLANDVNGIHSAGVDSHGAPAGAFFVLTGLDPDGVGGAALGLRVNPDLAEDSSLVAAGTIAGAGDNSVALDLAALRADSFGVAGDLRDLVRDAGSRAREAEDLALGQEILVESFYSQREEASGVSLDEEAADLMRFQRSYQAAARVMTIADEMAQIVLQM